MIRKDGIVQIMDFGLAKAPGSLRLTEGGKYGGTAGYMSPEQIQGQEVDHRSDIFSSVLLYELFTGHPPFKGVHETAITYEIVTWMPADVVVVPASTPRLDASSLSVSRRSRLSATNLSRSVQGTPKIQTRSDQAAGEQGVPPAVSALCPPRRSAKWLLVIPVVPPRPLSHPRNGPSGRSRRSCSSPASSSWGLSPLSQLQSRRNGVASLDRRRGSSIEAIMAAMLRSHRTGRPLPRGPCTLPGGSAVLPSSR